MDRSVPSRKTLIRILTSAIVLAAVLALRPAGFVVDAQSPSNVKFDAGLATKLSTALPGTPLEVVIVFSDIAAAPRVGAIATRFIQMRALPMAGAILTPEQIQTIATWPEVYSLTFNAPLKYFLHESVALVKADQVWSRYSEAGGNATVAVVDSGIDGTHPDLPMGAKVIQNVKVVPFEASVENVPLTDTTSGHGTHVAGTIAGTGAASSGYYRGVAPAAKLVGLGAGEGIVILSAVEAYDWILQHHTQYNIRVVSNSWGPTGGGGSLNLRDAVVYATLQAYDRGILSVFAAGNDGSYDVVNMYSQPPWVLSVAAGKKDGTLAEFSSRGKDGDYFKHPDITAPGVNIYATRSHTVGVTVENSFPNPVNPLWTPSYASLSGTSMATPHVSGAAALLFSNNPQLSPDQVIDVLTSTATPMPGTALHESGYGYMNVLAAFEASRSLTGNLPAFLAGQRTHSETEALGFDPNVSTPADEYTFAGINSGAGGVPVVDYTFRVPEGSLYVDVVLTWDPQQLDAFDLDVLDPQGNVRATSGNSVNQPERAFFVPTTFGDYILRLKPFAGPSARYTAKVKVAYGTAPANWPPTTPPAYAYYSNVTGIYKSYGAAGLITDAFRSGDTGFVVFTLAAGNGAAQTGQAGHLQAVYTDRNGRSFVDSAISERSTAGEYESDFDTRTIGLAAGPITLTLAWTGTGTMRALSTGFSLNKLAVSLETPSTNYAPGNTIAFSGAVAQVTTVATGEVQNPPIPSAPVTVSLRDATGVAIASTLTTTNVQGRYSGNLTAPASARGPMTLVAEAVFSDATTAPLGTSEWYGRAIKPIVFPGNMPPEVALTATVDPNRKSSASASFLVSIDASVKDLDGRNDVTSVSLVITDNRGRVLGRWDKSQFAAEDANTWRFARVPRLNGEAPWTVTLTAQDSAGQTATSSQTIR